MLERSRRFVCGSFFIRYALRQAMGCYAQYATGNIYSSRVGYKVLLQKE